MDLNIIINSITLLAIFIVGYYQREKIKLLEESISSQNGILEAVKTYFDIFKIDELKKYVALTEENYKKEGDKKIQLAIDEMKKSVSKEKEQMNKQLISQIESNGHLYGFAYYLLLRIPPRLREKEIIDNIKDKATQTLLLAALKGAENIYVPLQVTLGEQIGLFNLKIKDEFK